MAFRDLRELIKFLDRRGELKRVKARVSSELEITEIADRLAKRGGPALLFENVAGHRVPVLINAFATEQRMCWALGVSNLDELGDRVRKVLELAPPAGLMDKLKLLGNLKDLAAAAPKLVDRGPCQEVVNLIRTPSVSEGPGADAAFADSRGSAILSLLDLPVLKCWPDDGGPFITFALVITRHPRTGVRNVGLYRMQVYDGTTAGLHWHKHKGGAEHFGAAGPRRMEVAVAIGPDPTTAYAGSAPLPPILDEFLLAGFIRKKPVALVKCKTINLEVPASSEIVLEGYTDPGELRLEGPFGDHTGYYSLADHYPVFHLTAITHRRDPIYHTTIVGRPPMEDLYLGKATARLFLPLMQMIAPEIVDVNMPAEGVFHNLVIVSIKKRYPGQPHKVMYGLWGMGQMMFARNLVIVDEDVDVQNLSEVTWRVTNNVDAKRDLVIVEGPVDALDHAAPRQYIGGKLGIDATRKRAADGYEREWPPDIVMSPEIKARVDRRWSEYGL